jgi:hypothetical protein
MSSKQRVGPQGGIDMAQPIPAHPDWWGYWLDADGVSTADEVIAWIVDTVGDDDAVVLGALTPSRTCM